MIDPRDVVARIDGELNFMSSISLYTQEGVFRPIYKVGFNKGIYILKLSNSSLEDERKHYSREVAALQVARGMDGVTQLVRDYDLVEIDSGKYYAILKEYFVGRDLRQDGATNPKIEDQLRQIIYDLHLRGIVHMDLWPQNIVVSHDRTAAKIVDLGKCLINQKSGKRLDRLMQRDFDNLECLLGRLKKN